MGPYGPTIRPPYTQVAPVQVFPQRPPAQSDTSAIDAATLEYLRQQAQMSQQGGDGNNGSYAGAY
jgi:hypothetical protein